MILTHLFLQSTTYIKSWLHEAVLFNREDHVELLLEYGGDPNLTEESGLTPLHVAAAGGNFTILGQLLDAGGNPNIRDQSGYTPLMKAVGSGNPFIVSSLIMAGGQPYLQDYRGMNCFDLAGETHQQIVTILAKR